LCHAYSERTSEGFLRTITKQVALSSQGLKKAVVDIVLNDCNSLARFVNTCTLINNLIEYESQFLTEFKVIIAKLIEIMKEKTDQIRQSAATTLAKLCQDKNNLEVCRSLHGMEIMLQLQQHLIKGINK